MQASYGSNPKCDKRRNGSPDRLTKSVKDAKNMIYIFIFGCAESSLLCGVSPVAALGHLLAVASLTVEPWP